MHMVLHETMFTTSMTSFPVWVTNLMFVICMFVFSVHALPASLPPCRCVWKEMKL